MELNTQRFRTLAFMLGLYAMGIGSDGRASAGESLVLLSNGNVLKGTPQVQGHLVILLRDDGTQMRIPREQFAFAADSIRQLYEHRVGQRSFRSAAIYADDVSWCLRNDLLDEAATELDKLKDIDPSNPAIPRLQRQIDSARSPRSTVAVQNVYLSSDKADSAADSFSVPSGITPEAVVTFASKVQPMLINRCSNAGCHRTGSDTKWQLSHLGVSVRVSSKMTQRNLEATAPYLDFDDPNSSELLRFLLMSHAQGRYDTTGRSAQSAEFTLRHWLSSLGRYPLPITPGSIQLGNSDLPMPVSPTGYAQWPGNVSDVSPIASTDLTTPKSNQDDIPEGFAIDDEGQLIYDPDGEFGKARVSPAQPLVNSLVPPGYPVPIIGPETDQANGVSPVPTIPRGMPSELPNTNDRLPKRLPTVKDPFSADLFNRQSKLANPSP